MKSLSLNLFRNLRAAFAWVVVLIALSEASPLRAETIIYVSKSATALSDGNGWTSAYRELYHALLDVRVTAATAENPVQIWMAKGTYKPVATAGRLATFALPSNISIIGGFAGTETSLNDPRFVSNATVLSGDIGTTYSNAITAAVYPFNVQGTNFASAAGVLDNCYNVVQVNNATNVILSDLVITGGNADGAALLNATNLATEMLSPEESDDDSVAGRPQRALSSLVAGGGLFGVNCQLTLIQVQFINNFAALGGGMALGTNHSVVAAGCTFQGNYAPAGGGAVLELFANSVMEKCQFLDNQSNVEGGAVKFVGFRAAKAGASDREKVMARMLATFQKKAAMVGLGDGVAEARLTAMASTLTVSGLKSAITGAGVQGVSVGKTEASKAGVALMAYGLAVNILLATLPEGQAREIVEQIHKYATIEGYTEMLQAETAKLVLLGAEEVGLHFDTKRSASVTNKRLLLELFNKEDASLMLECTFLNNRAEVGGAVSVNYANVNFDGCLFRGNHGSYMGGAVYTSTFTVPKFISCVFHQNSSDLGFSAMCNANQSRAQVVNCTFLQNSSSSDNFGHAIGNMLGSEVRVINSILWSNSTPALVSGGADLFSATETNIGPTTYSMAGEDQHQLLAVTEIRSSCIQSLTNLIEGRDDIIPGCISDRPGDDDSHCFTTEGGAVNMGEGFRPGTKSTMGNISIYPGFADGFRVLAASPTIDTGDLIVWTNGVIKSVTGLDFNGQTRVKNGIIDMGATEGSGFTSRLYVRPGGSGNQNGSSWSNAMSSLSTALRAGKTEIWVAAGTYYPTIGIDRTESFRITNDVALYGGFAGTETSLSQRNPANNVTILSGDIGTPGVDADNSYKVIYCAGSVTYQTVIDGFTITKGCGTGSTAGNNSGSAVFCAGVGPRFENCKFIDNLATAKGGAVYTTGTEGPSFVNCQFINNSAGEGGAINSGTRLRLENCSFVRNTAVSGGALTLSGQYSYIFNSLFVSNSIAGTNLVYGAAIASLSGDCNVNNCTFYRNAATVPSASSGNGAALYFQGSGQTSLNIQNSIFWKNTATNISGSQPTVEQRQVSLSSSVQNYFNANLIEGLSDFLNYNNFDRDPFFANASAGDFRLAPYSTCINAGQTNGYSYLLTDLGGASRIAGAGIDVGAYEFQGTVTPVSAQILKLRNCDPGGIVQQFVLDSGTNNYGFTNHQWEIDRKDGLGFRTLTNDAVHSGATAATLTLSSPPISMNGFRYRIRASGPLYQHVSSPVVLNAAAPVVYVRANATGNNTGTDWTNAYTTLQAAIGVPNAWDAYQFYPAGTQVTEGNLRYRALSSHVSTQTNRPPNASAWAPVLVDECSQIWVAAGTYYISNNTSVPVTSYNVAFTNIIDYGSGYYVTNVHTTVVRGTNYIPGNNFKVLGELFTEDKITVGALRLRSNLRVYGGFTGTETNLAQRNWRTNSTIISGNMGNPADDSDNADNLFENDGNQAGYAADSTALLDGFTLTKARNTAMLNVSASPTIQNCTFAGNNGVFGGAIRNDSAARPVLVSCIFTGNTASQGAAINNAGAATVLSATNCVFNQNSARHRGGALANNGTVNLVNCVVANNSAESAGAGLMSLSGTTKILNTILWNNRITANAAALIEKMQIEKLSGTILVSNSCVQGLSTYAGNGNIFFDPLLVDSAAGNFRLNRASPAVNTGNSAFANAAVDLAGNPRIFGANPVDMGAYELQTAASAALSFYSVPDSITTCGVGGQAIFNLFAAPDPTRNFLWQRNSGSGFTNQSPDATHLISSSPTNTTLAVQNISPAMNGYQFRFIELNSQYTSAPVTLTLTAPSVIYVNVAANPTNAHTGTSWATAFTNISAALALADRCSEIWVAQGAYTNAQPLELKSGVSLLGGFAGTETSRTQRNWSNNVVYLRVINTAVMRNFYLPANDHSAVLDGFTIQAPAGQPGIENISASPTIRNCVFENHSNAGNASGYAVYNLNSSTIFTDCIFRNNTTRAIFNSGSSPRITGCIFQNNRSNKGAIENFESAPVIDRCVFRDNATAVGAGVYNGTGSEALITDSLFFHNTATNFGASVANFGTSLTIVNCTFTENVAAEGGAGVYSQQSDVSIANSIFWKNSPTNDNVEAAQIQLVASDGKTVTVSNSCVQGLSTLAGNGNISYDPLFLAPGSGNYRLNGSSPAINAGSSNAAAFLSLDLDGSPRAFGVVDMGAYELQTSAASVVRLFTGPASLSVCDGHQVSFNISGTNVFGTNFVWQIRGAGTNYVTLTNDANRVITATSNASTLTLLSVNSAMQSDDFRVVETVSGFVSASFQINVSSVSVLRVRTNAPAGGDGLSWNTAFNNLDDAFAAAGSCGELWIAEGTYGSTNKLLLKPTMQVFGGFAGTETARSQRNAQTHPTIIQQTIEVNADYGVALADTVIDGLKFTGAGCVEITDASPTIRNCVFQGLAAPGINSRRSSPVIDGCLFTNNFATAIQNIDTTAWIANCVFVGNLIAGSGAGIYNSYSSSTIVDCVFRNNRAFTGAGIWNFNSSPAINRCRFEGNLDGSAVFNSDKNSGPLISNCSFLNNTSTSYGGAIAHYGATLTLVNCTLTLNTAVANGGGIYAQSSVKIVNSILWNNSLTLPDKEATLEQFQVRIDGSTGAISNSCVQGLSLFAGNNNIGYDPLLLDAANGNLQLGDYSPAINGGNNNAISGALDLVRSNRLFGGVVDLGAIERQTNALGLVQMFSTPSSRSACVGRTVTFSAVGTNGSGATFQWQFFNGVTYVAVTNGDDNTITVSSNSSTLSILASTVYSKSFRLVLTGSGFVVSSFTFASTTPTLLYVKPAAVASGAGTSWATAFRTVQEAVAVADGCTDIWVASGTNAAGNTPIQLKSGVRLYGGFSGTETTRGQRNWTNNISLLLGSTASPAIHNDGRSTSLERSAVLDGFTVRGQGIQPAVFNNAASPTIRNCTFSGNAGPSINNQFNAVPLIDSCTFATNDTTATFLSTIYNFNASPTITNCLFIGNHSAGSGGAIENYNSAPIIAGCQFINNSADFNGGAIWNEGNSIALIVNCLFQTNSASGSGGAIYNSDESSVTVSSCLFAQNSAPQAGAIHQGSANGSLLNVTLYDNHATATVGGGGGIVQSRGALQIRNSILWRNRDETFAQNIEQAQFLSQGGTWSISNSCIEGLSAYAGNNNLRHDPLFVDPDTQNFQLSSYSPAANSGNNAAVLSGFTDLNGNARVFGANVDLGAYELQSAAAASPVQLISAPVSQTSCNGRITRFSTSGTTNTIAAVQWQIYSNAQYFNISNGPIYSITSNGTNSTLTISNTLPGMAGQNFRIVINGTSYASAPATLNFGVTDVIYVKSTGNNGDGRSWATAFNNLASALAAGDSCSEVWVAAGTYTSPFSLHMKSGLALYGGFNGTETTRSQRNWTNNISLLQSSGYLFDNYGGVTPIDRSSVLDGFTLTATNSDGAAVMVNEQASPTIRNCTFANCRDTAIWNESGSSPLIEFCTFTNNLWFGVYSVQSTPFISQCLFINNSNTCVFNNTNSTGSGSVLNCVFVGNTTVGSPGAAIRNESGGSITIGNCVFNRNVSASDGGAIHARGSTSTVYNCTFQGNTAANFGGAISVDRGTTLLINCTVVENQGADGSGGLFYIGSGGSVNVKNCIFWDNTDLNLHEAVETAQIDDYSGGAVTVRNSIVKGLDTFAGPGNIGFKPLFVNQAGGNLRLVSNSPGLNAGDNSAVTNITTDLEGAARIHHLTVDMGAYESTAPQSGFSQAPMEGSASVCSGKNFIFTIDGAGFVGNTYAGVKAVWQLSTGSGFVNISSNASYRVSTNGTVSTLTIVNATTALNGYSVRFVLTATNDYNPLYTIYTSPATTLSISAPNQIIYVNAAATTGGNGLSWATAFNDLQTALHYSGCFSEIWLAAGTYRPTAGSDRWASFDIPAGTAIYGGFAGNEVSRNQRNWTNNPTILSGDIGSPGDGSDNSFDVVVLDGLQNPMSTNTIVDGVIVENGVRGMTLYHSGAAAQNCVIRNQSGTGMDITGGSPALTACSFTGNVGQFGGGLYVAMGSPVILNCRFSGNSANYGGGIYALESTARLFNCLVSGNSATSLGGGIAGDLASLNLINCTVSGNSSQSQYGGGGGLGGQSSLVAMTNCIVWNNGSTGANVERSQIYNIAGTNRVADSCIDGLSTLAGNNNNGNDPRLVLELDPAAAPSLAGHFRLQGCSPLIDAGNNAVVAGLATDLDGGLRTYGSTVDVGAYELQSAPAMPVVLTQDPASFTYCSTGSNYFSVVVSGTGLSYQWEVNTGSGFVSLSNDSVYSGVTTATLVLSNAPPALNGAAYRCAIAAASGCTFHSRRATLTIYPSRLFVNAAAAPGGNGWSWATALTNLDTALSATSDTCNLEIWMAAGNYAAPSSGFRMKNRVAIYGGFNGTETSLAQRNRTTNQTILNGTGNEVIDNIGSPTPLDNTAVLDGCIVQNGTNGILNFQNSSPLIANCIIRGNSETGIRNVNNSSPSVFNCLIEGNGSLASDGGGMANSSGSSARITNCIFRGNIADSGGALWNSGSQPRIENCVFSGNYSAGAGGAIYNTFSGTVIIRNSTLTGNRSSGSSHGAGIFTSSAMEVYNSIVWNNVAGTSSNETAQIYPLNTSMTVHSTCFQGFSNNAYILRGNLDVDPQFISPISPFSAPTTNGNFHLLECSSLLNAGSNAFLGTWPADLDGSPRIYGTVDMGAYEAQYSSTPVTILTHPVSFSYCSASTSNRFTASASGPGLTYQWEVGDLSNVFVPVSGPLYSGGNTTNLVITGATVANNSFKYRCAITSSNGCTFRTTNATLTVNTFRYYVNPAAAINGTGTSWANAFNNLQSALAAPKDACGVEIWMAAGTNVAPSTGFLMANNTAIYGGFNGTETSLLERNWRTNFTVLRPSVDLIINNDGNFTPINSSAVIDGFLLTGANRSQTASKAIYNNVNAHVTIQNCTFRSNSVAVENFVSSPTIRNCLFEYNGRSTNNFTASAGGIYNRNTSSPLVDHCVFRGNAASSGAGLRQAGSGSPMVLNCVFSGNHATSGGAIDVTSGSMTLYHCTIVGNKTDSSSGAGLFATVPVTILNSIISSNYANNGANHGESAQVSGSSITISNSCLQGLTSTNYLGRSNTSANPLLINSVAGTTAPTTNGNVRLSPCSPAVGAGANDYMGGITTDIDSNPRLFGSSVDMGAHELQISMLQIITQPLDQSGDKDVPIQFNVAANFTNVTYQWQVNSGIGFTNLTDNSTHIGSTTATLVLTNETFAMNSNQYRCRVIGGAGCEIISSAARFLYRETINDAPTNIVLNASTVSESAAIGTTVGTFSVTDPDFQDSSLCSLVSGTGSADNAAFTIVSNVLKTAVTLNYEAQTNYSIRVRATDVGGLFFEKVFAITVINVNDEFPIISGSNTVSFAENSSNVIATYSATDSDPGDSITWLLSGTDATNFTLIAGTLRFIATPDYEVPRNINQDNVYLFNIGARDTASHTSTLTVAITVLNVPDGPYFVSTPITNAIEGDVYSYPVVAAHPLGLPINITAPQLPPWLTLNFPTTVNTLAGGIQAPISVAVNSAGTVYAGDSAFPAKIHRIGPAGADTLESVSVGYPIGIAASPTATNTYYFADYFNNSINRVVSGSVANTYGVTGPSSLAVDQSGNMYYTLNADNFIGKITPAGNFSVLAGSSTAGIQNGAGGAATFDHPSGLAVDNAGNVYVADYNNHAIRKVTPGGVVTTLAGNGTAGSTDATGTNARFNNPFGIAVDAAGNLYVADLGNGKIRRVTPAGVVTTVIQYPAYGVAVNAAGDTIYVADANNNAVVKILRGTIPTLTGTPGPTNTGLNTVTLVVSDGAQSTNQQFNITILSDNHRPVANSQSLTNSKNSPLNIVLTGSDSDNDPLTFVVDNPPTNGVLTGAPPNLTYTPSNNFVGKDSFIFHATDGETNSLPATISLTIVQPATPIIVTQLVTGVTNTAAVLNATVDPNGTPTSVYFQYGLTAAYGSSSPTQSLSTAALNFDGVSQFGSKTLTGLNGGNNAHTIEAWLKPTLLPPSREWVLLLGNVGAGSHHWLLHPNGATQIGVFGGNQVNSTLAPNVWTHLAASFDGSTLRVYTNGVLVGQNSAAFNISGGTLSLAQDRIGESFYGGAMDDLRIWNTARTASQIQSNYNATLTGSEPGLLAWLRMDEGSGSTLADASGHGNGINNSTATWTNGPLLTKTVTQNLSGLSPGATYHFRTVAANSAGFEFGNDVIFTTTGMTAGSVPLLKAPLRLGNGSFQFEFTNTPGASFTVLCTTNVALPLSNWIVLTNIVESPAGLFRFTDPQAATNSQRFYQVRSP